MAYDSDNKTTMMIVISERGAVLPAYFIDSSMYIVIGRHLAVSRDPNNADVVKYSTTSIVNKLAVFGDNVINVTEL